jgi:hypothetical protein
MHRGLLYCLRIVQIRGEQRQVAAPAKTTGGF